VGRLSTKTLGQLSRKKAAAHIGVIAGQCVNRALNRSCDRRRNQRHCSSEALDHEIRVTQEQFVRAVAAQCDRHQAPRRPANEVSGQQRRVPERLAEFVGYGIECGK
jgi:hypothetical protein